MPNRPVSDTTFFSKKLTFHQNGDWKITSLNAGSFSEQEWMQLGIYDMAEMTDVFIGREQAEAEVVALAWSPPGIAPRFRCALAILTSNGLLSIWTMKSSHFQETKWVRQVVVNKTPGVGTERILAMAWSPVIDSRKMEKTANAAHPCEETLLSKRYLLALFMEDRALKLLVLSRARRGSFKGLPPLTTYLSSPLEHVKEPAQLNLRNFAPVNLQAPFLGTAPHGIQWNEWKYCVSTCSAESDLFVRSTDADIHYKIAVTGANGQISYNIISSSRFPLTLEVGRHQIPHSIWKGGHRKWIRAQCFAPVSA
jgi:Transcription factor IIIC subunit delta N-term